MSRKSAYNIGFCASWARRNKPQHLYYYLALVPSRQNAVHQNKKTSTLIYKFG
jgi:hypothetical protein